MAPYECVYCFDIDGTICTNTDGRYDLADPYLDRIAHVNRLFSAGNRIKFFTARGSTTGIDWTEFTRDQLKSWGVSYHELIMGKPHADHFIDDRATNSEAYRWSET